MELGTALISTVVMGVLLVGAGIALARSQNRAGYTPKLRSAGGRVAALPGETVDESRDWSETAPIAAAALLAVCAGAAVLFDAVVAMFAAVALAAVTGYFAWGVYALARARGLPYAHSVGLSAWLYGVVLVGAVAVKLLVG